MWELNYTLWDGSRGVFQLSEGTTRIGRTSDNDLAIDDLALSGQHCELSLVGSELKVRDLDSSAGTFVDGEMIDESPLREGQTLNLGTFSITVAKITGGADSSPCKNQVRRATPVRLSDGSISCQEHFQQRALFECEQCFGLFCRSCFPDSEAKTPICPQCKVELKSIDWSGLSRTKEDVLFDLLPERVKMAVHYWERFNQDDSK